jgi:hypothetical protein
VDQRTFNVVAVIFALVALLHLLRIYMGWPIVIGSLTVSMWVSGIALVVAGGLSYFGLRKRAGICQTERVNALAAGRADADQRAGARAGAEIARLNLSLTAYPESPYNPTGYSPIAVTSYRRNLP